MYKLFIAFVVISLCQKASSLTCKDLLQSSTDFTQLRSTINSLSISDISNLFDFPSEAAYPTSNPRLRKAIYDAYGGIDFYTQTPMRIEDMEIDHVIPQSQGGFDNVFNYVPTTKKINNDKRDNFDAISAIAILTIVRNTYANRVLNKLGPKRERQNQSKGAGQTSEKLEFDFRPMPINKHVREFLEWLKHASEILTIDETKYITIKDMDFDADIFQSEIEPFLKQGIWLIPHNQDELRQPRTQRPPYRIYEEYSFFNLYEGQTLIYTFPLFIEFKKTVYAGRVRSVTFAPSTFLIEAFYGNIPFFDFFTERPVSRRMITDFYLSTPPVINVE